MNTAAQAFVVVASAVAANQLQLQMVQWVDVRKAVLDGARQRGVAGQAVLTDREFNHIRRSIAWTQHAKAPLIAHVWANAVAA
jgi:hypothetical protein